MTLIDLKAIRDEDIKNKNSTYIVAIKKNDIYFIRDELCMVESVDDKHFVFFRPLDGKRYTMLENNLKNFKLIPNN
jgi:hypothetical protein